MLLKSRTNFQNRKPKWSKVSMALLPLQNDPDSLTIDTPPSRALATRLRAPPRGRPPIALPHLPRALLSRAYKRSIPTVEAAILSYMGPCHHPSTLGIIFFCAYNPLEHSAIYNVVGRAAAPIHKFILFISSIIPACPFCPFWLLLPAHTGPDMAQCRVCSSETHSINKNTTLFEIDEQRLRPYVSRHASFIHHNLVARRIFTRADKTPSQTYRELARDINPEGDKNSYIRGTRTHPTSTFGAP